MKPLLKINTAVIADNCLQEIDKETVDLFVNSLIDQIDQILRLRDYTQTEVIINLDVLGKITRYRN